jgi:uncharacterized protein YndB with AHSA1/START domain
MTGEVTIEAPIEEVFDLVADERNEPKYNPRMIRAEKVSQGPVATGSRFVTEVKNTGGKGEMTVEIVEYDKPHRLRIVVRSSSMHVEGTLRFEPAAGRTRLSWDWNMSLLGRQRMLAPVLALVGPRWERRNWVGLKKYMESGGR